MLLSDVNEEAVTRATQLVRSNFPASEAYGVKADVSKETDVASMVQTAVERWGRLDVLVRSLVFLWLPETDESVQQCWDHAWRVSKQVLRSLTW